MFDITVSCVEVCEELKPTDRSPAIVMRQKEATAKAIATSTSENPADEGVLGFMSGK
jgi:hypothetical protein